MSDPKHPSGLQPESEHPVDERLWNALGDLPQAQPGENLRRDFYRRLGEAQQRPFWWRWWQAGRPSLAPALATLVLGLALGVLLAGPGGHEIDRLRDQVASLNATVALTLMEKGSTGERLQGVNVAATLGASDPRLAEALLQVAGSDTHSALRSAAVDALGPHLRRDPGLGEDVERLVMETHSPLVQLALVELVFRFGAPDRQRRLLEAAEAGRLLPDVNRFIVERIERIQT